MAAFNIDFGQKNIENAQKSRELSLREKQIDNQRRASEMQAFAQASSSSGFRNAVAAREANELRARELALREKQAERSQSWSDLLNQQRQEETALRIENLRKSSEKYDLALESDRMAVEEAARQTRERQRLLNSELGTLFLSSYKNGGVVSPSQIKAFNDATGEQFDFLGNSADIPLQNGRVVRQKIGDGKGFWMGKFERDQKGNIVFGKDGTPVTSMVEMPRELQQTILTSAYGKNYLGGGRGGSGMSEERMQLERERLAQRKSEEEGRIARAGAKNDAANARLAASVAKNMGDIKRGLRLNDEQAASFQTSLTKILSDAFSGGGGNGGAENPTEQPKGEQQGQARQISSPSEMADAPVGSWFVKGDKKYIKQENGQFLPEE